MTKKVHVILLTAVFSTLCLVSESSGDQRPAEPSLGFCEVPIVSTILCWLIPRFGI